MGENVVGEFRANRRAKGVLNRMLASKQITSTGLKWLEIATDPFHDTEIVSDGYPDMVTTRSITQCVTKTFNVIKPSATTWDAHIFFNPLSPSYRQGTTLTTSTITTTTTTTNSAEQSSKRSSIDFEKLKKEYPGLYQIIETEEKNKKPGVGTVTLGGYYRSTIDSGGRINQAGTGNLLYSGWNVMSIPTGQDWQTQAATAYTDGTYPRSYGAGTYRLIATGVEVVNTTAALYKGGAVTVYRSPCPKSTMTGETYSGTSDPVLNSLGSFPVGILPPSTQANASLFPNSKTWGAEEGVYIVGALNTTENPYYTPAPGISGLLSPTSAASMEAGTGWVGYLPRILKPDSPADNHDLSACSTVWPWDVSGCVFSGLNENSTLQVTVRYYIERHPSIAEPDLLVLARTPCPYDPTVQEIYARAMHELPVGVPVGMNPLGEWFNEVLDAVATWAPQIGSAVGNIIPGANIVGKGIGMGAQAWRDQRKNTKGAGGKPPVPPKGGTTTKKVKFNAKGKVKEIDTVIKKPKYTAAQKRAFQSLQKRKAMKSIAPSTRFIGGGTRARPPGRRKK